MPEITVIHIVILAGTVAAGVLIGWIARGSRCAQEKIAVNEGWQQQLEVQRGEHERLLDQNKSLMEQISQLQASGNDAGNRAKELSSALKEAFERRDELQRELKDIRSNLELAVQEREKLQSDMRDNEARGDSAQNALKDKDDKIFRLSRELENWQNRLPPLIERFRQRDTEAEQLEEALQTANDRITELESEDAETRIEAADPEALGEELDASNDPSSATRTGIGETISGDDETAVAEQLDEAETEDAGADEIDADDEEPPVAETEDANDEFAAEVLDDEDSAIVEESRADDAAEPAELAASADFGAAGGQDDLQLIKGIGPAIEKTLNELGIRRFDQIAAMSEYDIDRVAQRLKGFRTRIYREDWIGQARDLQLKKTAS